MGQERSVDIQNLRALIQSVEKPLDREHFFFSSVPTGIPKGTLVEITGPGKTEAVARFLSENSNVRAAWIEDDLTVYPYALLQRKVFLNRMLFIEARKEIFWAASQVLRSGIFECVVISFSRPFHERVIRRLQLEVEKANAGLFFLPAGCPLTHGRSWAVSMKLQAQKNSMDNFELHSLRERGA